MDTLELKTLDVDRDIDDIETAAKILLRGGIVAIPTETVYGLAADALNPTAVKNIYAAKGRPSDNPLIVHVANYDGWKMLVKNIDERAMKLAEKFWPGPLTIILPKSDKVPDVTSGGLDTVAVRMPSNPIARKIIELSTPLAAPSANLSGLPSPTTYAHVRQDLMGRVDAICDGGDCSIGVESTVITFEAELPTILRPGQITVEQIREVIGDVAVSPACLNPLKDGETAASPGMKYKHYSPNADITVLKGTLKTFINYLDEHTDEFDGVMCFDGEEKYFPNKKCVSFGKLGDMLSITEHLYTTLRAFDELGAKRVLCRGVSERDEGLAVCNRLYRAAAFNIIEPDLPEMVVIGLTGATGSGKGYVGRRIKEKIDRGVLPKEKYGDLPSRDFTTCTRTLGQSECRKYPSSGACARFNPFESYCEENSHTKQSADLSDDRFNPNNCCGDKEYSEKEKCYIIDTDELAHTLLLCGSPVIEKLTREFGDILRENGDVDRKKLGRIVFSDANKLERLNRITHPEIVRRIREIIDEKHREGIEYIIVDAPLLFESGADRLCDYIVAVTAPVQTRLKRIMSRDSIDEESARARINSQPTDEFYIYRSDEIIENE